MIKIAHRGNIVGPKQSYENDPSYIEEALQEGYDVEIDLWLFKNKLFLGHDLPEYRIEFEFLKNHRLWCHCKNIDALMVCLDNDIRCFFHDIDAATLTSDGYVWTFPGEKLSSKSICVMPEKFGWQINSKPAGICSDYVGRLGEFIK